MQVMARSLRPLLLWLAFLLIGCGRTDDHPQTFHQKESQPQAEHRQRVGTQPAAVVDGRYLRAWSAAAKKHLEIPDLSAEQRRLENHMVQFSEEGKHIVVIFMPRLSANEYVTGGETARGRAARYEVDKITYQVTAQVFYE